jgi:hypothetical protein
MRGWVLGWVLAWGCVGEDKNDPTDDAPADTDADADADTDTDADADADTDTDADADTDTDTGERFCGSTTTTLDTGLQDMTGRWRGPCEYGGSYGLTLSFDLNDTQGFVAGLGQLTDASGYGATLDARCAAWSGDEFVVQAAETVYNLRVTFGGTPQGDTWAGTLQVCPQGTGGCTPVDLACTLQRQ